MFQLEQPSSDTEIHKKNYKTGTVAMVSDFMISHQFIDINLNIIVYIVALLFTK
jgi:hypothetical protein